MYRVGAVETAGFCHFKKFPSSVEDGIFFLSLDRCPAYALKSYGVASRFRVSVLRIHILEIGI